MKCLYCKREAVSHGFCQFHIELARLLRRVNDPRKPKNRARLLTQ